MENLKQKILVRINGIGHAFSRELGCICLRCKTINFAMSVPSGRLERFDGWDDPPWRAHTSASILISDTEGQSTIKSHILIDIGAGVVDSLVSSKLKGLERIEGILISHWHPDHVLGLNQLCENLRRNAKRNRREFVKLSLFCTLKTYNYLQEMFSYELGKMLRFSEILPGIPFKVNCDSSVTFTPLEVAHGNVKGSVIYIADIDEKKIIFGWDIDVPEAERPLDKKKNIDVIRDNLSILEGADLLFMPANTWEATGTGHTSFILARQYIGEIKAKKTLLVHISGHEDGKGNPGYGWSDSDWASQVSKYGVGVARQGMLIKV